MSCHRQCTTLVTRSVAEVCRPDGDFFTYFVPDYQRGYRWCDAQVLSLLEDLERYAREHDAKPEQAGDFYCLQPIVVQERAPEDHATGRWELVDGQQRLTTIAILCRTLGLPQLQIHYETRPDSRQFLQQMPEAGATRNPDYYRMFRARQTIRQWLTPARREVLTAILQAHGPGCAKFIWYQLEGTGSPEARKQAAITAFVRLNAGKIPLTEAELIRALFLQQRNFTGADAHGRQFRLGLEWDRIERSLQSERFWAFLGGSRVHSATRIDLLFQLRALVLGHTPDADKPNDVFVFYSTRLAKLPAPTGTAALPIEREWAELVSLHDRLREWFEDRETYHTVGFLLAIVGPGRSRTHADQLHALYTLYRGSHTRSDWKARLRAEAWSRVVAATRFKKSMAVHEVVERLHYEAHGQAIDYVLVLFNIQTVLDARTDDRYPFHRHVEQEWHKEHIHSQASDPPKQREKRRRWLELVHRFWSKAKLLDGPCPALEVSGPEGARTVLHRRVVTLLRWMCTPDPAKAEESPEPFDGLYQDVLMFGSSEEAAPGLGGPDDEAALHRIGNLALLDSTTNQSYGNQPFFVKRAILMEKAQAHRFVPRCTLNTFLKAYGGADDMMVWTDACAAAYQRAVAESMQRFTGGS